MTHAHRAVRQVGPDKPFVVCVAPNECDPVAHGNISYLEECSCGMRRVVNSNAGHREYGDWFEPA